VRRGASTLAADTLVLLPSARCPGKRKGGRPLADPRRLVDETGKDVAAVHAAEDPRWADAVDSAASTSSEAAINRTSAHRGFNAADCSARMWHV
jgi:hypothetical protein